MHEEILSFLNKCYSQYHSIFEIKNILDKEGFIELNENTPFNLIKGNNYYVIRNLTSIIAFKIGKEIDASSHFQMVATHSDSPTYKIKDHIFNEIANVNKLTVEPYGGVIHSVWLDKPLSIAGRVVFKLDNKISSKLVAIDKDLCIIPNLAIHMNREINNGYTYNPQYDLCPLISEALNKNVLEEIIKSNIPLEGELINYDLFLYNREQAKLIGYNDDFIASPKLDDLASAYSALKGFINASNDKNITVYCCFDNEEVGSTSINGANSNFLDSILKRIYLSFNNSLDAYFASLARSSLISADNAHAIHPNHIEKTENDSPVVLNKGVVLKHNANMHYCSEGLSSSLIVSLGKENNLNIQEYFNRSDIRGGGTLGNISISHVSILSVDIGLPQLAMHSNYETMGSKDYLDMINLIKAYMEKDIVINGSEVLL